MNVAVERNRLFDFVPASAPARHPVARALVAKRTSRANVIAATDVLAAQGIPVLGTVLT